MPTQNVNLTNVQDGFIEEMVKSGKYQDASEAADPKMKLYQVPVFEGADR